MGFVCGREQQTRRRNELAVEQRRGGVLVDVVAESVKHVRRVPCRGNATLVDIDTGESPHTETDAQSPRFATDFGDERTGEGRRRPRTACPMVDDGISKRAKEGITTISTTIDPASIPRVSSFESKHFHQVIETTGES